ncbi:hypothetical protein [Mucilaginibacter ginsenosidivorax]|uniref:Uncharacterized protein n=1 Tax=Mucilaginibacter ginsenosidivorax TaxID=862126 RepID=A0A5B8VZ53_9SPHI|nr:hypothetical protein [Mucilaginibacter ginsenosidivorax]QEC76601.1 hypothetical protein FSB76_11810 [Mucilaginibacter ginsenosidivorax]
MLSHYIQSAQTALEAGMLYRSVNDFVEKESPKELRLPIKGDVLVYLEATETYFGEDFKDNTYEESRVKASFSLPTNDFLLIVQAWLQFLVANKTRKVEVTNGQGIIEIITDGFLNALVIEEAVAVNWPDCRGSIGEYYSVSDNDYQKQLELTVGLDHSLAHGSDNEILEEIIKFLDLFDNGNYDVAISRLDKKNCSFYSDSSMVYSDSVPEEYRFACNYYDYGSGDIYLFTRRRNRIDQNRVDHYVNLINEGARPKAIIYYHYYYDDSSASPNYVLDGHHKILAYQQLDMDIPAVIICKRDMLGEHKANILPYVVDVLKLNELRHAILENENVTDIDAYRNERVSKALDDILLNYKGIGIELLQLFYNAWHSPVSGHREWAAEKLSVLQHNINKGKGQTLYRKTFISETSYPAWVNTYIENDLDFEVWKKILLNGEEASVDWFTIQKTTAEKYNPSYRNTPNPPITRNLDFTSAQPTSDESLSKTWPYIKTALLVIRLLTRLK